VFQLVGQLAGVAVVAVGLPTATGATIPCRSYLLATPVRTDQTTRHQRRWVAGDNPERPPVRGVERCSASWIDRGLSGVLLMSMFRAIGRAVNALWVLVVAAAPGPYEPTRGRPGRPAPLACVRRAGQGFEASGLIVTAVLLSVASNASRPRLATQISYPITGPPATLARGWRSVGARAAAGDFLDTVDSL
jgi:hypothetical protein